MTDPLQRLDRAIKIMVAMITLAVLALVGLRMTAGRSLRVDVRRECEQSGRRFDAARRVCLPP